VAILDYDRAVSGDPSADLGKFLANLEKFTLRGNLPRTKLEALKNALLEGYQYAARGDIPARIELYTAAVLLQIARRRFRHRKPDWAEATEAILERAEDILKIGITGNLAYRLQAIAAKNNDQEEDTHAVTG
jgi:aminoglycoside phosphotransferase (APT) family kinase protein